MTILLIIVCVYIGIGVLLGAIDHAFRIVRVIRKEYNYRYVHERMPRWLVFLYEISTCRTVVNLFFPGMLLIHILVIYLIIHPIERHYAADAATFVVKKVG